MDPDIHTSQQLRFGLKRKGWEVEETHLTVRLIFPVQDTNLKGTPDMRRRGKDYLVIIPGEGREHPMKEWLRANPQYAPEGKDPFDPEINSQTWRRVLSRNGWGDEETDTEVRLIFPTENEEEDTETPSTIAIAHETTTHKPPHSKGLPDMRQRGKNYLVVLSENEKHPMMKWLRLNPEYLPEGRHPDTHTSRQLRSDLEQNGWEVNETRTEVNLIFPSKEGENDVQTSGAFPLNEENHVETPRAFALEQHLRDYIAKDIHKISFNGGNLKLFQDQDGRKGVEYPTDTGRIDILAISGTDNQEFFVIELKLSRGSDQAIGQLMRYMSWVEDRIANGRKVNGIIVAQSIDDRLKRAARMIPSRVELFEYKLIFDLTPVSLAN